MASKKKQTAYLGGYVPAKSMKGDVMAGYISTNSPTSPDIQKDQFGTSQSRTEPTNVPLIQTTSPPIFTPIHTYQETSDAGSTIVRTITPGKTLMITAINLSTTGVGAITENSETMLWVCKAGGTPATGTSRQIAYVPDTAITGSSNILQLSFVVPLAFNSNEWEAIWMEQKDDDVHCRVQIYGYEIQNT